MGARLEIHKRGFIIDANGIPEIEEAIGTKRSINFKETFLNINVREVDGLEVIELVDVRKPNRRLHYSAISEVIDIDGVIRTGTEIDSNYKILSFIEDMIKW